MNDSKKIRVLLWTTQVLLAALFLFAGIMKLVLPSEALTADSPLPGWFLRFTGIAETLGGLGLVLPGLTRIQTRLAPLAASGLAILMMGATVLTLATHSPATAAIPLVVGALCAFVAYGRTRVAPHGEARRRAVST